MRAWLGTKRASAANGIDLIFRLMPLFTVMCFNAPPASGDPRSSGGGDDSKAKFLLKVNDGKSCRRAN